MSRRVLVHGVAAPDSIGFAIARALVASGAVVHVTARPHRFDGCVPMARTLGVELHPWDGDLAAIVDTFDTLDALVHTRVRVDPGVLGLPLLDVPDAALIDCFDGSVLSLLRACRSVRSLLAASGAGRVVTLTSDLSRTTAPNYHAAGIAKSALESTMRYLAAELGPQGVLVNAVSFPLVPTTAARSTVGSEVAQGTVRFLARRSFTGSVPTAEDVAATVAWLAGANARQITGTIVRVDAGIGTAAF